MKKLDLVNGIKKNSDFLGIEKDGADILNCLIGNDEICKLLYFNTEDALSKELTESQKADLIELGYINLKPVFPEDEKIKNFIMISFDNFSPTDNPQYIDYTIDITIFCHADNFNFKKGKETHIRDLYIAHLILGIFNQRKLNGIGKVNFAGAQSAILGSDTKYSGKILTFVNYHSSGQAPKKIINNNTDGYE